MRSCLNLHDILDCPSKFRVLALKSIQVLDFDVPSFFSQMMEQMGNLLDIPKDSKQFKSAQTAVEALHLAWPGLKGFGLFYMAYQMLPFVEQLGSLTLRAKALRELNFISYLPEIGPCAEHDETQTVLLTPKLQTDIYLACIACNNTLLLFPGIFSCVSCGYPL